MTLSERTGKIIYGVIFTIVVPALLFAWGWLTGDIIHLPLPLGPTAGWILSSIGAALMTAGMAALRKYGNGLPMNAYPPPQFVSRGVYGILSHPIYTGFCCMTAGVSLIFQSSSGVWLVTPFTVLACAAIVYGYEKHDLNERFGASRFRPFIALPSDEDRPAFFSERLSVYILLFVPWIVLYEAAAVIGVTQNAIVSYFPFEEHLPVIEWTEIAYLSTYFFVAAVPVFVRSSRILRRFTVDGLVATAFISFLFFTVPLVAPPRDFSPASFWGRMILLERSYDTPAAAFPSFHVVWAFLAARAYALSYPRRKMIVAGWAAAITVSCLTTGMHSLIDIIAGIAAAIVVVRITRVWNGLRSLSERIANSWKEWRIGTIRIINHGAYAGAGTCGGLLAAGILLGPSSIFSLLIVASFSLVAAALWAQFIEGSPSLLRPYGYYGGLIGGMIGCVAAQYAGTDLWLLLAVFGTVGPWIQAAGRVRCLVQGCCHGHPAGEHIGIKYTHPRSRVVRLAGWSGVSLHPTPLYSILWNIATGIFLARLWSTGAAPNLIAGLYLVVNGLGRFVEESFRGEPQTPVLGTLRLYQLMAILSVVIGMIFSMIDTAAVLPSPQFHWNALWLGLSFGLFTWFALGVDFPDSNKRFARLV